MIRSLIVYLSGSPALLFARGYHGVDFHSGSRLNSFSKNGTPSVIQRGAGELRK